MALRSKLPDVGVTIFTVMSKLAQDTGAINLSQGFPDFQPHPELVGLVNRYMRDGFNQYAPMQGAVGLRRNIAEKVGALYGAEVDPDIEITVTAGATEALFASVAAVVHPGDEVILLEPAFDAYEPAVRLSGGVPVLVPLTFPDYRVDWERVKGAVTNRTRMLIINSPHNPTGTLLKVEDIRALQGIVSDQGLFILSDEVYEHILFDGRAHESMMRYPDLAERSFVISSFGKTYHATGWKVGYCIAPVPLSGEFRKIHQYLTFCVNTPIQHALAEFMRQKEHYLNLRAFYQQKRDFFLGLLARSRFRPLACEGTYFLMADYSAISDEPDTVFVMRLTREYGVAMIPPSVFYHDRLDNKVVRLCFAKQEETLERAAERLCRI